MVTIEVPASYGYVLLSAVSTFITGTFLGIRVGRFRKAARIPYPYEYASYEQVQTAPPSRQKDLLAFNSAQRGHPELQRESFFDGCLATDSGFGASQGSGVALCDLECK
ncbi:hypothetical protein N0V90_006107 [Kalmusia sp. IMI 367209]|nr:hypothetical protein N0V90_006107 [Kalmusia sp. IMI 367209]